MLFAPMEELVSKLQNRSRVFLLAIDSQCLMFRWNWQPGFGVAKPGIRQVRRPWHRRPAAVPPLEIGPELDAVRVLQIFEWNFGLRQPQFFSLINAGASSQRQQDTQQQLGQGAIIATELAQSPKPPRYADIVMITHGPRFPTPSHNWLGFPVQP